MKEKKSKPRPILSDYMYLIKKKNKKKFINSGSPEQPAAVTIVAVRRLPTKRHPVVVLPVCLND